MIDFSENEWFLLVEDAVIKQYNKVKVKGEIDNSVLAAFLLYNKEERSLKVLSLATGTKSMSGDQREQSQENGPCFIHDCHAEILAHRCFQLWCWNQLQYHQIKRNKNDFDEDVFEDGHLKHNFSIHFYTSTPPCGDCCVHVNEEDGKVIIETGAKPFGCDQNDLFNTPPNIVRGKPGRGSRSQVVSCSDKITMWLKIGIEGNFLSNFIHVELSSLLIGDGKLETCKRSLFKRINNEEKMKDIPIVCHATTWESNIKTTPSSSSFTWFLGGNAELIEPKFGRRVGVILKNQLNPKYFPSMCDAMMAKKLCLMLNIKNASIKQLKSRNPEYNERKKQAKEILISYGGEWSKKFEKEKEWVYDEVKMMPIFNQNQKGFNQNTKIQKNQNQTQRKREEKKVNEKQNSLDKNEINIKKDNQNKQTNSNPSSSSCLLI